MAFDEKKEKYGKVKVISTEKVKTDGKKMGTCRGMGAAKSGGKFVKDKS